MPPVRAAAAKCQAQNHALAHELGRTDALTLRLGLAMPQTSPGGA